jgi:5-hydroxyisourate hydrolase-like protein (transthyretin family)
MKRAVLSGVVFLLIAGAAVYSRQVPPGGVTPAANGELKVAVEEKNPWTSLKLNNSADQFQFAIVTDRTGGHRAKVFSQAMTQINLLQPEFVVSVGDLIEGYTVNKDRINAEWDEFNGYVNKLEMPFFYVPGNHDLTNKTLVEEWGGRYGRKYYHFLYKDVLFLCLNSEDPSSRISPDQAAYFQKVLDENKSVRWTLVFLHKPLWAATDLEKNGWAAVETALTGRKYTAYCGHVHRYQKFVRNGMNHYQLATTGGGSRLRGAEFGEFDQVAWVTMKQDGPRMANLDLSGVLPEDLKLPDSDEKGRDTKGRMATEKLSGTVTFEGKPAAKATLRFYRKALIEGKFDFISEGYTDANGRYEASTYKGFDGIPVGEYKVTITQRGEVDEGESKAPNLLPAKYAAAATTPLTVTIKAGPNQLDFDLTK